MPHDPLAAARAGDGEAFIGLVRAHDPRLRRLAGRLVRDHARVDDVLQEAYVRAFRAIGSFRADADLGTWLHRITYNCCIDELRRARRQPLHLAEPPERAAAGSGPGRQVTVQETVRAALATLPEEQRVAVLLVDGNELDYDAAAEVLGIPRGTVTSRVSRARQVLRARLALDEEVPDDRRS